MKKRILYAEANYAAMVRKNGYFVDKTEYIDKLERVNNPVFLRPRRFGKSLWCTLLEHYYSIRFKDRFDELFSHTWIGKNPTALHNTLLVLHLDFSTVETGEMAVMEASFNHRVNLELDNLVYQTASGTWGLRYSMWIELGTEDGDETSHPRSSHPIIQLLKLFFRLSQQHSIFDK